MASALANNYGDVVHTVELKRVVAQRPFSHALVSHVFKRLLSKVIAVVVSTVSTILISRFCIQRMYDSSFALAARNT